VMNAAGNVTPAANAHKRVHMMVDLRRSEKHFGLPSPIRMSTKFPMNTLTMQRVLTHLNASGRVQDEMRLAERSFLSVWSFDEDLSDVAVLRRVLSECGLDADALLAAAATPAVKDALRVNTDECVAHGAFGAPWLVVRQRGASADECFFGSDRFPVIAELLGKPWYGPLGTQKAKL